MNQDYLALQPLFEKYNADPNDASFSPAQKALLDQLKAVQTEAVEINKQIEQINKEIKEKQEKGAELLQQSLFKQGQNQGLLDALMSVK